MLQNREMCNSHTTTRMKSSKIKFQLKPRWVTYYTNKYLIIHKLCIVWIWRYEWNFNTITTILSSDCVEYAYILFVFRYLLYIHVNNFIRCATYESSTNACSHRDIFITIHLKVVSIERGFRSNANSTNYCNFGTCFLRCPI